MEEIEFNIYPDIIVSFPVAGPIILVTFTKSGIKTQSRLDTQKIMFIDAVPAGMDSKDVARQISRHLHECE